MVGPSSSQSSFSSNTNGVVRLNVLLFNESCALNSGIYTGVLFHKIEFLNGRNPVRERFLVNFFLFQNDVLFRNIHGYPFLVADWYRHMYYTIFSAIYQQFWHFNYSFGFYFLVFQSPTEKAPPLELFKSHNVTTY